MNENEVPLQDFVPRVSTSTPVKHVPSGSIKHLSNSDSKAIYNADLQVFTFFIIFILLYYTYINGLFYKFYLLAVLTETET